MLTILTSKTFSTHWMKKVKVAKRDFGVRVFNLSFRLGARSGRLAYSLTADRLDRMARANDVVFVVASGTGCARLPSSLAGEGAGCDRDARWVGGYDQNITAPRIICLVSRSERQSTFRSRSYSLDANDLHATWAGRRWRAKAGIGSPRRRGTPQPPARASYR